MPAIVNVHEAKAQFSKLLEHAHAGAEITNAKAGIPYAKLARIADAAAPGKRQPGGGPILGDIPDRACSDPRPPKGLATWEGEAPGLS